MTNWMQCCCTVDACDIVCRFASVCMTLASSNHGPCCRETCSGLTRTRLDTRCPNILSTAITGCNVLREAAIEHTEAQRLQIGLELQDCASDCVCRQQRLFSRQLSYVWFRTLVHKVKFIIKAEIFGAERIVIQTERDTL
jgi:hypothetical protein